jgi:hypothetical protein
MIVCVDFFHNCGSVSVMEPTIKGIQACEDMKLFIVGLNHLQWDIPKSSSF